MALISCKPRFHGLPIGEAVILEDVKVAHCASCQAKISLHRDLAGIWAGHQQGRGIIRLTDPIRIVCPGCFGVNIQIDLECDSDAGSEVAEAFQDLVRQGLPIRVST